MLPRMALSKDDLPAPTAPTMATSSPSAIRRLRLSSVTAEFQANDALLKTTASPEDNGGWEKIVKWCLTENYSHVSRHFRSIHWRRYKPSSTLWVTSSKSNSFAWRKSWSLRSDTLHLENAAKTDGRKVRLKRNELNRWSDTNARVAVKTFWESTRTKQLKDTAEIYATPKSDSPILEIANQKQAKIDTNKTSITLITAVPIS